MNRTIFFLFFLLSILFALPVLSQTDSTATDSTVQEEGHTKIIDKRPRNAAIMSALLPGLGQIYNKKYWKVPIIYIGLGALGYFFHSSNLSYYNNLHMYDSLKADPNAAAPYQTQVDFYHKNRDLGAILIVALYALNIVDATVDAHLREFDINENLSLRFKPLFYANYNSQFVTGLTANISFKK